MKTEIRYYMRRVIGFLLVGAVAFLLKSCMVNAETLTPTTIYSYNGSNNWTYTGTSLSTLTENNISYVGPVIPANRNTDGIRFRFQNVTFANNSSPYQLTFTGMSNVNSRAKIPVVYVQNGTRVYGCYVNATIETEITGTNVYDAYYGGKFNVICPNVVLNGTDISIVYKYDSWSSTTQQSGIKIGTNFGITLMTNNSDVVSAITSQQTQQHQDAENTQNAINDIGNDITSSSVDTNNANNSISGLDSSLPSGNVLGNLITMPVTLTQKFLNGLNGQCSPMVLGTLFNTEFKLPCVDLSTILGTLWNILDVICSGFIAYEIGKHFVLIFHKLTTFDSGTLEEVYK